MHRVLFVCVENANRSQVAQAYARILGNDRVHAESAGSRPSGHINAKAIRMMAELDYDMSSHESRSLDQISAEPWDVVVTMGCGDHCPALSAKRREDWALPDPRDFSDEDYRRLRDEIGQRVRSLLASL